jgi:hypothetical protein
MGAFELPLIVAGWLLSAGIAGVGGVFVIQGKNNARLEKFREFSEAKIEKVIKDNDVRIEAIISANKAEQSLVLEHLRNMEKCLNDMRAELPEKYTLKSDHLRLADKVEDLTVELYRHREILLGTGNNSKS